MSSNNILSPTLIESGRDIPLQELLFAKRVLDNYLSVAQESSPIELLAEMPKNRSILRIQTLLTIRITKTPFLLIFFRNFISVESGSSNR